MNTSDHSPFRPLCESLAMLTRSMDARTLRDHLQGRRLPALGGNIEPAETILRAFGETPNPERLATSLAPVLAQVIVESRAELQNGLTPILEFLLHQALRLAADLPANTGLAASLEHLIFDLGGVEKAEDLEKVVPDFWLQAPLAPPLARALVHQQTDAGAERLWYGLLKISSQGPSWTDQKQTVLLSAWRGLLYVPPDPETARDDRVINIDRIERGLLALEAGLRSHEGGLRLLFLAIEILINAFPRSPEFWWRRLGHLLQNAPPMLQEALTHRLPKVAHTSSVDAEVMLHLQENDVGTPQGTLSHSHRTIENLKRSLEEAHAENARLHREIESLRQQNQKKKFFSGQSRQGSSGRGVAPLREDVRP